MPCKNGIGSRCSSLNSTSSSRRSCSPSRQGSASCREKRKRSCNQDADANGNCFCGGNRQRDRFQHPEMWNKGCVGNPHALRARLEAYNTQQRIANGKESCCPPPVPLLCHIRCIARQKGVCAHKDGCCPCCCPTVRCPCNDCCFTEDPTPLDPNKPATNGGEEPQVSFVQPPPAWNNNNNNQAGMSQPFAPGQPASTTASEQQLPSPVQPRLPPLQPVSRPQSQTPTAVPSSSSKPVPGKRSSGGSHDSKSRSKATEGSSSKTTKDSSSKSGTKSASSRGVAKSSTSSSSGSKGKSRGDTSKGSDRKEKSDTDNDKSITTSKIDLKDTATDAGSAGRSSSRSSGAKYKQK